MAIINNLLKSGESGVTISAPEGVFPAFFLGTQSTCLAYRIIQNNGTMRIVYFTEWGPHNNDNSGIFFIPFKNFEGIIVNGQGADTTYNFIAGKTYRIDYFKFSSSTVRYYRLYEDGNRVLNYNSSDSAVYSSKWQSYIYGLLRVAV